jgi:SAM-dependent methyltransferase
MTGRDFQRGDRFDEFAGSYDCALAKGLSSTGENREFFARGRIRFLQSCLGRLGFHPENVLEFGCGTGSNLPLLREITGAKSVLGIDVSEKSIEVAKRSVDPSVANFARPSEYRPAGQIDLAFCNGVFHHIDPALRASAVEYIRDCLRPGGMFALWENNPWNPGTRLVIRRIPFDRDAITLTASEGRNLLKAAGLRILRTDYLFIFPHALRWLRALEVPLSRLPLGGQYQILGQKPGPV